MYQLSPKVFQSPPKVDAPQWSSSHRGAFTLSALAHQLSEILRPDAKALCASTFLRELERHVGEQSTFTQKAEAIVLLTELFHVLRHESCASKRNLLATILTTDLTFCTNGFYNRVVEVYQSQFDFESLEGWLHDLRVELVGQAARYASQDVHTHNRYFTRASLKYGVRPIAIDDVYVGEIEDIIIDEDLKRVFERHYQPLAMVQFLAQRIERLLVAQALLSALELGNYDQARVDEIVEQLNRLFHHQIISLYDVIRFDEDEVVVGFDHAGIKKLVYQEMVSRGYFVGHFGSEVLLAKLFEGRITERLLRKMSRRLASSSHLLVADLIHHLYAISEGQKLSILQSAATRLNTPNLMHLIAMTTPHFKNFEQLVVSFPEIEDAHLLDPVAWGTMGLLMHYRNKEAFEFCLRKLLHFGYYDDLYPFEHDGVMIFKFLMRYPSTFEACLPYLCEIPIAHLEQLVVPQQVGDANWLLNAFWCDGFSAHSLQKFCEALPQLLLGDIFRPLFSEPGVSDEQYSKRLSPSKFNVLINICLRSGLEVSLMNYRFANEKNILHVAAAIGNVETFRQLFVYNNQIDCVDAHQRTPLHYAAKYGHRALTQFLIKNGASFALGDIALDTPLHLAAQYGRAEVACILLEHGANINEPNNNQQTPLHMATFYNHLELVKCLIEHHANIDAADGNQATPLHEALITGHLEIAKFLIANHADIHARNKLKETPLHLAVGENHDEMVRLLLERRADITLGNHSGATPLHYAASQGHLAMLQVLVETCTTSEERRAILNIANDVKQTILHYAVSRNQMAVVQYLIGQKVSLDAVDNAKQTALHFAVMYDHLEMLKFLMENGSTSLNAVNQSMQTPLHIAIEKNNTGMVKYLLTYKPDLHVGLAEGGTLLHVAAMLGHVEIVQCLVAENFKIDIKNHKQQTPLHAAVLCEKVPVIEYLLVQGADIESTDYHLSTPLHYAVIHSHLELVKFLVDKRANVNAQDHLKLTPLHHALKRKNFEISCFLAQRTDLRIVDIAGETPLHMALIYGYVPMVKYLVAQGANINIQNQMGCTPLHIAVAKANIDMIEFLLASDADVNVRDAMHASPLHYASRMGLLKGVQILLQKGADVNAQAKHKNTALHFAVQGEHLELVKILLAHAPRLDIKNISGQTALDLAIAQNYLPIVGLLQSPPPLVSPFTLFSGAQALAPEQAPDSEMTTDARETPEPSQSSRLPKN